MGWASSDDDFTLSLWSVNVGYNECHGQSSHTEFVILAVNY